jgi:hypothetical protein
LSLEQAPDRAPTPAVLVDDVRRVRFEAVDLKVDLDAPPKDAAECR